MEVAKYCIKLDWKEFNVCLASVDAWAKANAGSDYCGNQAHSCLELWFKNEPSQEIKDAIAVYWNGLSDHSDEAYAYKSSADIAAEVATAKASAKAKLAALGLSDAEIAAITG